MTRYQLTVVLGLFLGALTSSASGVLSLSFEGLSNNSIADTLAGEAQLSVDVESSGGGVLFTFINIGIESMSITDVYFDDNLLLALDHLIDFDDGAGGDLDVDFTAPATPAELPSANSADPDFETTAGLSADSDSPIFVWGVNPGETLGVFFTFLGGKVFQDVLDDLDSKDLRIGIKVQGFEGDGSETFINNGNGMIPAPGALLLGSMGMGIVGWLRRRRML